jgi:hypothetical protein
MSYDIQLLKALNFNDILSRAAGPRNHRVILATGLQGSYSPTAGVPMTSVS